jgi:hypothetical protein
VLLDIKPLDAYLNKESLHHLATTLNSKEFVIGHRFLYLMARIRGLKICKVVAAHAYHAEAAN